jgi:transcriptional regulator with XRE-family HTH domain
MDVAERAGFSVGYLSQIERGISSPSLRTMVALGDVFGVGLAGLFDPDLTMVSEQIATRVSERQRMEFWRSGIDKELLSPPNEAFGLNLYVMTLDPGGSSGEDYLTHAGEEAGLVLEGRFELDVDENVSTLEEGDSFRFVSKRRHRYCNPSNTLIAKVLWALYTPKDTRGHH